MRLISAEADFLWGFFERKHLLATKVMPAMRMINMSATKEVLIHTALMPPLFTKSLLEKACHPEKKVQSSYFVCLQAE